MAAAEYIASQSEAAFQETVVEFAEFNGWYVEHIRDMRGNRPGTPDLMMWRNADYVLAELKVGANDLSEDQKLWHAGAAARGVKVYTWRPSDWPEIEQVLKIPE